MVSGVNEEELSKEGTVRGESMKDSRWVWGTGWTWGLVASARVGMEEVS